MLSVTVEHNYRAASVAVSFQAPLPGITVLFGPSGAGKSTVLAAMAGLLKPNRLSIDLAGDKLHRLPPHRRRIGMVFQDGRLFPHMTVKENLMYGLKRAPAGKIYPLEIVALLGLEPLLNRRPATLSGGERQRAAIARALLAQPRLLLMDEPLASLDTPRRAEIMPYLIRLRDTLRLPIVYVTHAYDEMQQLADHVVLINAGRVLAAGPLSDIAARVDLPLAARDDAAGVLNGYMHSHEPERRLSAIACGGQIILVPQLDIEPRTPRPPAHPRPRNHPGARRPPRNQRQQRHPRRRLRHRPRRTCPRRPGGNRHRRRHPPRPHHARRRRTAALAGGE